MLRWTRSQLSTGQQQPAADRAQLDRVRDQLPALARTLHRGPRSAIERGDVFVRETVLQKHAGSLVYRATERWRPALSTDDAVRDLSRMLRQLGKPPPKQRTASSAEVTHAAQLAQGYPTSSPSTPTSLMHQDTNPPSQHGFRPPDSPQPSPLESL